MRPAHISPLVALVQLAMLVFLLIAICGGVSLLACVAHGAEATFSSHGDAQTVAAEPAKTGVMVRTARPAASVSRCSGGSCSRVRVAAPPRLFRGLLRKR